VVVSFPAADGWKDCAVAALIVATIASATIIFEMVICVSKWFPPIITRSGIQIGVGNAIFPAGACVTLSGRGAAEVE
jgi:hypothetical protein